MVSHWMVKSRFYVTFSFCEFERKSVFPVLCVFSELGAAIFADEGFDLELSVFPCFVGLIYFFFAV